MMLLLLLTPLIQCLQTEDAIAPYKWESSLQYSFCTFAAQEAFGRTQCHTESDVDIEDNTAGPSRPAGGQTGGTAGCPGPAVPQLMLVRRPHTQRCASGCPLQRLLMMPHPEAAAVQP